MANAFLNGEFLDSSEAKISILDRGFLFGDAVYEVIPVFYHKTLHRDWHLERLQKSLDSICMENPYSPEQWDHYLDKLLDSTNEKECCIYLQVSRGATDKRDFYLPKTCKPTVFIMITGQPPKLNQGEGISAVSVVDQRWHACHIKANTLLPNVLAKHAASQEGVQEAIYIRSGFALEGSSSNLFIVSNNQIVTPPLTENILPGITRKILLTIFKEQNLSFEERVISYKTLQEADEIWLTSSTQEIVPVTHLDQFPVKEGKVGPMWKQVNKFYQEYKYFACSEKVVSLHHDKKH